MTRSVLSCIVVAGLVFAGGMAHATTIKVPGDYDNIQDAVDNAANNDTISVAKGTWNGTVTISGKTGIQMKGKGKPVLDADGGDAALEIKDCTDVEISEFVVVDAEKDAVTIADSQRVKLTKCTVRSPAGHGVAVGGCTGVTIEKNLFDDCGLDSINLDTDLTGTVNNDCTVQKNRVVGSGDDGIDVIGDDHLIQKNRIEDSENDGIKIDDSADSSGTVITKNTVRDSGETGIVVKGDGNTVSKNKVTETGDDGIRSEGDGNTIEKNKVLDAGEDGLDMEGERNEVEKNKVINSVADGIDAQGPDNTYRKNTIKGSGDDGVYVDEDDNTFDGNKISKSGDNGFEVDSGGNEFYRNKIGKNGGLDVWDGAGAGANTWDKSNKYKTSNL